MSSQKKSSKQILALPEALNQFSVIIAQHPDAKRSMDFYARTGLQFALSRLKDLGDKQACEMLNRFIIMYEESGYIDQFNNRKKH